MESGTATCLNSWPEIECFPAMRKAAFGGRRCRRDEISEITTSEISSIASQVVLDDLFG